jgi:hypothetical protein
MKNALFPLAFVLAFVPLCVSGKTLVSEVSHSLTQTEKIPVGHFEWEPEKAIEGSLAILVSLPRQMLYVYRGNVLIARSTISSGRPGRSTPSGNYRIRGKEEVHHSNLYDNAPMPFMQRLTDDGVALHAGYIPEHPASHGCIRLPREFAQKLFRITSFGDPVLITGSEENAPKGDGSEIPSFIPETLKQFDSAIGQEQPNHAAKLPSNPLQSAEVCHSNTNLHSTSPAVYSGKTMRQLETEELAVRNDPNLSNGERKLALLRIWSAQLQITKNPITKHQE